jgi:hypothetical protein
MQTVINKEKNIARGKSNIIPKNKANVKGAMKKLDTYVGTRAAASAGVSSGVVSEAAENLTKKKDQDDF